MTARRSLNQQNTRGHRPRLQQMRHYLDRLPEGGEYQRQSMFLSPFRQFGLPPRTLQREYSFLRTPNGFLFAINRWLRRWMADFSPERGRFPQQRGRFAQQRGPFARRSRRFARQSSCFARQSRRFAHQTSYFANRTGRFAHPPAIECI
jgi:hypothetical protein